MKLSIQGKLYDEPALDKISLRHLLVFDGEVAAALGDDYPWTWRAAEEMSNELRQVSNEKGPKAADDVFEAHPHKAAFLTTLMWVATRQNGEARTFDELLDVPAYEVKWVPEPKDHAATADPTKRAAAKRPAPRKGSARGGRPAAAKRSAPKAAPTQKG